MSSEIPFIKPSFPAPEDLSKRFAAIAERNWYTNFGPEERAFRSGVATYVGPGAHAATSANGTLALLSALHAVLPRGEGTRYLLMPSFTFAAVAQCAIWHGYLPWFVDIDPKTWQPSAGSARDALSVAGDRVAGLLAVNVFGTGNPSVSEWEALARENALPLVIDSAAGFGSRYPDGSPLGLRGDCEIFSFHATKPFAIGEGGAVLSRDPHISRHVNEFQNFGFDASRSATTLGINGKMSEMTAAVGNVQLEHFDLRLVNRRRVFEAYRSELLDLSSIQFQPNAENSSLCFVSMRCASASHKAAVLDELERREVQARDYYNPPVDTHPVVQATEGARRQDLAVTRDLCQRIVSLPVHDSMMRADLDRVVGGIRAATEKVFA